jgi:hypothetical protein
MPGLSPRSHADDRDLAAKPTPVSHTNQGYLMMEKTALGSRSNCAAQAWPNQVTGAASPNGSSRRKSRHRSHSPDTLIGHCTHRDPTKHRTRSSLPVTSDPRQRSSPQSIPIGHATPQRRLSDSSPVVVFVPLIPGTDVVESPS